MITQLQLSSIADSLQIDRELAAEGIQYAPEAIQEALSNGRLITDWSTNRFEADTVDLEWNFFYSKLQGSCDGFISSHREFYRKIILDLRTSEVFSEEEQYRWAAQMLEICTFIKDALSAFSQFIGQSSDDNWKLSAVGDLHQHGMITLRIEMNEGVYFLKKRPFDHYGFIKNILDEVGLKCISLPNAFRHGDFIIEHEIIGARCSDIKLKQAVIELEAFSYALGVDDLHFENVLETENGLVIVDYETYLNPIHQTRHGGAYLKNMSVLSNLFSARGFRRPTLNGLHDNCVYAPTVNGIESLSRVPTLSLPDCHEVLSIGQRLLNALLENIVWSNDQYIRLLLDPTKLMLNNVKYFSDIDSPGDTLAERWIARYASTVFDLPHYDPLYFARIMTCALRGFIPCFYHKPQSSILSVDTYGTSMDLRKLPVSGFAAAQMRRHHHERNYDFNARHLFFLYNHHEAP